MDQADIQASTHSIGAQTIPPANPVISRTRDPVTLVCGAPLIRPAVVERAVRAASATRDLVGIRFGSQSSFLSFPGTQLWPMLPLSPLHPVAFKPIMPTQVIPTAIVTPYAESSARAEAHWGGSGIPLAARQSDLFRSSNSVDPQAIPVPASIPYILSRLKYWFGGSTHYDMLEIGYLADFEEFFVRHPRDQMATLSFGELVNLCRQALATRNLTEHALGEDPQIGERFKRMHRRRQTLGLQPSGLTCSKSRGGSCGLPRPPQ